MFASWSFIVSGLMFRSLIHFAFILCFRPLENSRASEMLLGREKGRPNRRSWLRLYAIKLNVGIYIITGGAIKLTRTMQEREHTLQELEKMEKVRNFLIREGVFDEDSFTDYQQEVEL